MTMAVRKPEHKRNVMSYDRIIISRGDYVEVRVSGIATYANAVDLWQAIGLACEEHQCFKVLGEQNVPNPLSTMEAWKHQQIFLDAGIDSRYKIAWVDTNPRTYEVTNFIRTVLRNRDIAYGKVFSHFQSAKDWLLNDAD